MSLMQQSLRAALASGGGTPSKSKGANGWHKDKRTPVGSHRGTPRGTPVHSHPGSDAEDDEELSSDSEDIFSPYASTASTGAAEDVMGLALDDQDDSALQEMMRVQIDSLNEKRTSTREEALQWLIRAMSMRYAAQAMDGSEETFFDALRRSIRAGKSSKETLLAARATALWFVTLGAGREAEYTELASFLKPTIKSCRLPPVKAQCILTLAMSCFVACQDPYEIADTVRFCHSIASTTKETPEVKESALVSMGLLLSCLDRTPRQVEQLFAETMGAHRTLLESSSLPVRIASGHNIALFYHTLGVPTARSLDVSQHTALLSALQALATDSSRSRGKKERSRQRAVFRDVLHTVHTGESPVVRHRVMDQSLAFDDWAQIHRFFAFRTVLNQGLHTHFEENDLLHDVFGAAFATQQLVDPAGERVVHDTKSAVAKYRAIEKSRQLEQRYNQTLGMYNDSE
ncbi:Interferon- developmental regulator 1 [Dimargaris xerosporica]|nr:Interferon- developmental regulator 1 [Dimargaris xerosporica]